MVRILSNGEIVADDDPRANQRKNAPNRNPQSSSTSRQFSPPDHQQQQQAQRGQQHQGALSPFTMINEKLLSFGIPRWSLGNMTVEPIVSVALLLSVLFFGLPGILLVVILFVVSQLSMSEVGGDWMQRLRNVFVGGGGGGGQDRANRGVGGQQRPNIGRPRQDQSDDRNSGQFGAGGRRLGD